MHEGAVSSIPAENRQATGRKGQGAAAPDAAALLRMAERVGFEPTVPSRAHRISSPAHSAALTPLHLQLTAYD